MDIHGSSLEILRSSMETHGLSMDIQRESMEIHGYQWISLVFEGMENHGTEDGGVAPPHQPGPFATRFAETRVEPALARNLWSDPNQ
jgi:hypothetical protein